MLAIHVDFVFEVGKQDSRFTEYGNIAHSSNRYQGVFVVWSFPQQAFCQAHAAAVDNAVDLLAFRRDEKKLFVEFGCHNGTIIEQALQMKIIQ